MSPRASAILCGAIDLSPETNSISLTQQGGDPESISISEGHYVSTVAVCAALQAAISKAFADPAVAVCIEPTADRRDCRCVIMMTTAFIINGGDLAQLLGFDPSDCSSYEQQHVTQDPPAATICTAGLSERYCNDFTYISCFELSTGTSINRAIALHAKRTLRFPAITTETANRLSEMLSAAFETAAPFALYHPYDKSKPCALLLSTNWQAQSREALRQRDDAARCWDFVMNATVAGQVFTPLQKGVSMGITWIEKTSGQSLTESELANMSAVYFVDSSASACSLGLPELDASSDGASASICCFGAYPLSITPSGEADISGESSMTLFDGQVARLSYRHGVQNWEDLA